MKTFPGWRAAGHAMRWARTNSITHQADPWPDEPLVEQAAGEQAQP